VWIRRVMNQLYGIDEKAVKEMNTYAKETFGEYGGIAQQYLFYYIRGLQ
jgi:N-glycosylase/DNA lyase